MLRSEYFTTTDERLAMSALLRRCNWTMPSRVAGLRFVRRFSATCLLRLPRASTPPPAAPLPIPIPSEPPLRATIFDERGRVTSVDAYLERKRFLKENGLHSRDLRHIDGPQRALVPYIQVNKGSSILVNICDLRVLIKSNQVLVFHSMDPAIAERLSMLVYDFTAKLGNPSKFTYRHQDYEQTALEIVLIHAVAYLEVELNLILKHTEQVLEDLEHELSYGKLRELLRFSRDLRRYYRRSLAVRKALDDALDDGPGLLDMYLTDSARGTSPKDYNDIEILLETYYSLADELVQKAGRTVREVGMTEEVMNMVIDANRNSLILYRLEITVLTVGLGLATFLADLYGMNLENFIEEKPWGMPSVSLVIAALAVAGTMFNFKRLAYTRRVFMPHRGTIKAKHNRDMLKQWLQRSRHTPNPPNRFGGSEQ